MQSLGVCRGTSKEKLKCYTICNCWPMLLSLDFMVINTLCGAERHHCAGCLPVSAWSYSLLDERSHRGAARLCNSLCQGYPSLHPDVTLCMVRHQLPLGAFLHEMACPSSADHQSQGCKAAVPFAADALLCSQVRAPDLFGTLDQSCPPAHTPAHCCS